MVKGLKNPHLRRESSSLRRTFVRRVKNRRRPAIETYKYDASGNILEKVINGQKTNYSYDKGNQLASSTVNGLKTDYNYDAAGRMSNETTAGVTKTYTYGWLDKVTKVTDGKTETSFSYYADGQLAQKKSGETVENFYWDELALLRRGDTNYLNDPAVTGGNPILADNTILFTDMLGNTLGSVENEVFQPIGRTAFGESTSKQSASLDFFTGKPQVDGLGYNFLLRNYNAQVGKWQTQDPLGYPDGWNNFAYCNSDVLNAVDAMGGTEYYFSKSTDSSGNITYQRTSLVSYVFQNGSKIIDITIGVTVNNNGTITIDALSVLSWVDSNNNNVATNVSDSKSNTITNSVYNNERSFGQYLSVSATKAGYGTTSATAKFGATTRTMSAKDENGCQTQIVEINFVSVTAQGYLSLLNYSNPNGSSSRSLTIYIE